MGSVPRWGHLLSSPSDPGLRCYVTRHGVSHKAGSLCICGPFRERGGQQLLFRRKAYSRVFYFHTFHLAGLLLQTSLKHRKG